MSVYGEWLAATIDSGETSSDAVNLGRDYDFIEVQIPTLDNDTYLKLQTCETKTGTYKDLGNGITTSAGTHNYNDVWGIGGWQFIKVVADNGQDSERKIRVRGMRY